MEYRKLGRIKEQISLLGFGCMRFPRSGQGIDEPVLTRMFDAAIEGGVNYFDTAYMYHEGQSEGLIGRLLTDRYPRDSFFLADKLPGWLLPPEAGPEYMKNIFEEQLQRLHTDHIDFYLMHSMDSEIWPKLLGQGALDFLHWLRQDGRARYIGFSYHDMPEQLLPIISAFDWDFAQIQMNYFDWKGPQDAKGQYEVLSAAGLPMTVMEPVRGGALANLPADSREALAAVGLDSPAIAALRWAASHGNILTVLSGMSSLAQMEENCRAFSPFLALTGAEKQGVEQALALMKQRAFIPCTGCRYCSGHCPVGLELAEALNAYNEYTMLDNDQVLRGYLAMLREDQSRPADCLYCGACVQVCPQHIDIPDYMRELAGLIKERGL